MPASYPIPSWLQPSDPTGNLLAGLRQGAALGEAQAQQAQFQQQLVAHQQEQQQRLQAEALRTQAEMATQKAYREAQQSLAQDRLKEEAKRAEEIARHNAQMEAYRGQEVAGKTSDEAAKYLARQKFATAYQQHLQAGDKDPMMAALLDVPEMITPTTLNTGARGARGGAISPSAAMTYRHALEQMSPETDEERDLIKQRKQAADSVIDSALGIQKEAPKLDLSMPPPSSPFGLDVPMPQLNTPMPVMPPPAAQSLAPASDVVAPKRIRVKSPEGKIGNIPESQLDDALAAGYSKVE